METRRGNLQACALQAESLTLGFSPCIDAGVSNSILLDISGESRWDDPNHANVVSIWDIGADEFVDADADGMADAWEVEQFGDTSRN